MDLVETLDLDTGKRALMFGTSEHPMKERERVNARQNEFIIRAPPMGFWLLDQV